MLCPFVLAVLSNVAFAAYPSLRDHPIASGSEPLYLDGAWNLARDPPDPVAPRVTGQVPGDILTDLQRAKRIWDPYFNSTWQDPDFMNLWNTGLWTYNKSFATPSGADYYLLVFDGIHMGARISLNGKVLGIANNQFLRYVYQIESSDLRQDGGTNTLSVTFGQDLKINCGARFTYSNQIDWAPTMLTKDPPSGRSTFGFGIYKSVYLLPVTSAAITQLVPHTFYAGGHPTSMLADSEHKGFDINVGVELHSPTVQSGTVTVSGSWGGTPISQRVSLSVGNNSVELKVPAEQTVGVRLWHPNGHGGQYRYTISAGFTPDDPGAKAAETSRMMGFRHVALVTVNDTDPAVAQAAATKNGTGQFTMFFRVNGAPVYARGGNKIPIDLMDGRNTAAAHRRLVQSAAEGNFNMLRVWGGGIWEPTAFWEACDEFGILLYTDMQFTWTAIGGTPSERTEQDYQIKRLSHHPAIALWSACNECGGGGLYESFVMPNVAAVDKSRPIWPACPASGWLSGVDQLSSRPNGKVLKIAGAGLFRPAPFPFDQEQHGPYTGFFGGPVPDVTMPVASTNVVGSSAIPANVGPGEEGWYRSEFGANGWSSFESVVAQLPKDQWSLSSPAVKNRNWNVSNLIQTFFGDEAAFAMGRYGEAAFKKQLYQSMIGQLLYLKTQIESWRSQNVWGTTFWMYNEIWPTGGWGSIEYGSPVPGQVEGGRWKPLHYALKSSTFADQLSTCNTAGACFVRNDSPFPFSGKVRLRVLNTLNGKDTYLADKELSMPAGAGVAEWFCGTAPSSYTDSKEYYFNEKPKYGRHCQQIPSDRLNYTAKTYVGFENCIEACDQDKACLGFTLMTDSRCWLYDSVPKLQNNSIADFWQKPGTAKIPAPPQAECGPLPPQPPPSRPAPPQLKCSAWGPTLASTDVGCDENLANCVLVIEVANSSGVQASLNVVPFLPPKAMRLPKAAVTATVGSADADSVEIVLSTTATALYVTLTTAAQGRFSDNAFLLEAGKPRKVFFLAWNPLDADMINLLKASLRVEHLVDNLDKNEFTDTNMFV